MHQFELVSPTLDWRSVASSFADLGLPGHMVTRLEDAGITAPFPIQAATVPDALAGRDVCGRAPTGSGKTWPSDWPWCSAPVAPRPGAPRGLVLVPTRELASQVHDELAALARRPGRPGDRRLRRHRLRAARRSLDRGVDIVVACPGRLEDLIAQGALRLGDVRTVVLDEADRMVDMGFLPAVRRLSTSPPPTGRSCSSRPPSATRSSR